MIVLLTAVAMLVIGVEIVRIAWRAAGDRAPGPLERTTMAAIVAAALWLGSTWALALLRQLTETTLAVRAAVGAVVAVVLIARRFRDWTRPLNIDRRTLLLVAVALLPVLIWTELILWRGAIVPPLSHDALSYHLPKAVLFARAEGFRYLTELEPRQRNIPANYEMLLTELVVTQKSDAYTEWPSAAFYVLFIIACGALVERWWGRALAAPLVVMTLAGGIPVLLLHSGAHKNDVMVAFFAVATLVFAGRYLRHAETAALLLLICAVALGLGTKPQPAALAAILAPFVIVRALRTLSARACAGVIVFGVAAFLLLGSAVYVVNVIEQRALVGKDAGAERIIAYGDWRNLYEGPYVLLAAPFSRDARSLRVPWEEKPWFWRRYEIYFSHLGIPFALCAAAMPFAFLRLGADRERTIITIAALGAFAAMLPVVFRPHGMFSISLPRYVLFLVPVVFSWTIAPLVRRMRERAAAWTIVAASLLFVGYAVDAAVHDRFAPLDYVLWASENPGTRVIPFDSGRAASVVDRLAGPRDTIALDCWYASWSHPAFGANLTRRVHFIPPGEGPPSIPADAQWVAIDRHWGSMWDVAGFEDLSQADEKLLGGTPKSEELRVARYLARDPRFRLVYARPWMSQFVFRRVQ